MEPRTVVGALTGANPAPFEPRLPGSKSLTQRALLLAAQRPGTTHVRGASLSADALRLATALDGFGGLAVERTQDGFRVERTRARLSAPREPCDVGGSATAARLLVAFAVAAEGDTVVTGDARLRERPMGDLLDALARIGVDVAALDVPKRLPVRIRGGAVTRREWRVAGNVSSQFTSALLLLAAQGPGPCTEPIHIVVEGEPVSRPYVDMTLALLARQGVAAHRAENGTLVVEPGTPRDSELCVEPDASALSYFLAAAAMTCTRVAVAGLGRSSLQGDVGFGHVLARMGAAVDIGPSHVQLQGAALRGIDVDLGDLPDVALTLAAVAATAEGPTRLRGLAHLRVKESDRIRAAAAALRAFGVPVAAGPNELVVQPEGSVRAHVRERVCLESCGDHRVAMSFALLGLVPGLAPCGVEVLGADCVDKSFPEFWSELERFRAHHAGAADSNAR